MRNLFFKHLSLIALYIANHMGVVCGWWGIIALFFTGHGRRTWQWRWCRRLDSRTYRLQPWGTYVQNRWQHINPERCNKLYTSQSQLSCMHGFWMVRQLVPYITKKKIYQACSFDSTLLLYSLHLPDLAGLGRHHRPRWQTGLPQETLSLPRTYECFDTIENDPLLDYDLPRKAWTLAGQVLKHCYSAVDRMLAKQWPCIWKVGYTHCAHFRFYNLKFGYKHEIDKWQMMIVIYAASETISPAFVEGAIIQRHKGFLNAK